MSKSIVLHIPVVLMTLAEIQHKGKQNLAQLHNILNYKETTAVNKSLLRGKSPLVYSTT